MKKIFQLTAENNKPERVIEKIKHDIKKYVKRERNKKTPDDDHYWEFDCKFGKTKDSTKDVIVPDISGLLDIAAKEEWKECYIQILSKLKPRAKK
ncbi:MAG: Unknown protein [uncultured Campylobacterales bacterium]|uniref:Uncharacterized protein n=1 Tax=uncultured Campylobacterales bacterium TaxID=352960 RepID=A0A6S6TLA9_9BACT|nr:MAG: Unknown protein [uncultured Campylobacterales bacterium]